MDLTIGEENTRGRVTPVPLTEMVKNVVEAMAASQGIAPLKFINKKGKTLAHHDWITGVDYDTINDFTETEDIEEQELNEIFKNDPVEVQAGAQVTNPNHGELVEDEEEIQEENQDIEQVIDEMIDELNNEIVRAAKSC